MAASVPTLKFQGAHTFTLGEIRALFPIVAPKLLNRNRRQPNKTRGDQRKTVPQTKAHTTRPNLFFNECALGHLSLLTSRAKGEGRRAEGEESLESELPTPFDSPEQPADIFSCFPDTLLPLVSGSEKGSTNSAKHPAGHLGEEKGSGTNSAKHPSGHLAIGSLTPFLRLDRALSLPVQLGKQTPQIDLPTGQYIMSVNDVLF